MVQCVAECCSVLQSVAECTQDQQFHKNAPTHANLPHSLRPHTYTPTYACVFVCVCVYVRDVCMHILIQVYGRIYILLYERIGAWEGVRVMSHLLTH